MTYWKTKFKIGLLEVPRFIGGPLDGVTDAPFRQLVRQFSKDALLYGEMRHVSCIALNKGRVSPLDFSQLERPLTYQVSAHSVDFIASACEKIMAAGVDCLDLNAGCPARNVINSGCGSALMNDLPRFKSIVQLFRQSLTIPFTVKIRAGFKVQNAVDVARMLQDCGVDALAIHPRLQTQQFMGQPDYALAAEVKKVISIPVMLSGGIVNEATAKRAYDMTGVDGYLIGRGMWSKPWKLKELEEHAAGRPFVISSDEIHRCALEHFESMIAYYGQSGLYMFRKHLPFYLKGKPGASDIRAVLARTESVEEVRRGLDLFFKGEEHAIL